MRRLVPLSLVLLVAACGQPAASAADGPKSALGFEVHAGAVQFPSDSDWVPSNVGLKALVPVNGCVLGLGDFANGYRDVNANWTGDAGCTELKLSPSPGSGGPGPEAAGNGWRGGGLPAVAAVPGPDGSVIGAHAKFARRDADGTITELGELRGQRDPRALARSGGTLVAVGSAFLDGQTTRPVAWVSDDDGKTERTVVMPVVEGGDGADAPWSVAAAGPELLAAGFSNPQLQLWASHDGGGSWTVSQLATPSDQTLVYGILPAGGRWLLYGEVSDGHSRKPFVRTGKPGAWSTVDVPGPGAVVAATLDARGDPVLAEQTTEPLQDGRNWRYCSAVVVREGQGWQRGELGCGESPVRVATTLADGRVLIAGNRDLWLRPAR
ncbi:MULTISPECIES: hypothetical protein [Amycolatopsis]|uniref:Exo-alpha-sialidase n=1 Tax=Amycolatopsis bullii TaxID=941987 RepID=A0ABQ3KQ06_9PSEU|nr:hypothetical protein [Amycolatopsis bullii]GHG38181.1 hypothetical protein GCM10017567_68810 [Amycolatopsis bullii]